MSAEDDCPRCGAADGIACAPGCPLLACDSCGGAGHVIDLTRPLPDDDPLRADGGLWYWCAPCPKGCP